MIRYVAAAIVFAATGTTLAEDFTSGSDGSDGVFAPSETVNIDLRLAVTAAWGTPSPSPGNGVYDPTVWAVVFKYDTIHVPPGVTVKFINHPSGAPVVWLAQGDVIIEGAVNLNGKNGWSNDVDPLEYSVPGPGGFQGGGGSPPGYARSAGFGPGGGGDEGGQGPCAYANTGIPGQWPPDPDPGQTYGTSRIFPLIGGSGGAGDRSGSGTQADAVGGAGGGAILIACSGMIDVPGTITASGGAGSGNPAGYAGSGGAIRLIADTIVGTGLLSAPGHTLGVDGGKGRIRLETTINGFVGTTVPDHAHSGPGLVFPPLDAPVLRVVEISSATSIRAVPPDPVAGVDTVDVCTDDSVVTLHVEAQNIPVDASVRVFVRPAHGAASTFVIATPLIGDFALSTTSAEITLPNVPVEIQLKANWTP